VGICKERIGRSGEEGAVAIGSVRSDGFFKGGGRRRERNWRCVNKGGGRMIRVARSVAWKPRGRTRCVQSKEKVQRRQVKPRHTKRDEQVGGLNPRRDEVGRRYVFFANGVDKVYLVI